MNPFRWMHEHSYHCRICGLPRFFIRRDHMDCVLYEIQRIRREELER